MRFSLEGLKPTAYAPEIRECFCGFRNANVALVGAFFVVSLLSQFRFGRGAALYVGVLTIPIFYLWSCVAYGRLASCFGQSSSSFAVAAFFLYPYEMVLGYFAFNKGIRDAFKDDANASFLRDGKP